MSNSFLDEDSKSTDISIWTPTTGAASPAKAQPQVTPSNRHIGHKHRRETTPPIESGDPNKSQSKEEGDGSGDHDPKDCDEAHFAQLREKCADLVWNCLQGLISILDAKDFKAIQS
jgi:hypothetical protein